MNRLTRRAWLAGAAAGALAPAVRGAKDEVPGPSQARIAALRRGVNLSRWFSGSEDYDERRMGSWIGESDLSLIDTLGLNHVRLPVDPAYLIDADDPEALRKDRLDRLDRAVQMILTAGLAVIVVLDADEEFKFDLARDRAVLTRFEAFWSALATHLKPTNPNRVFLEVLSEPAIDDPKTWRTIQGRLLKAMRAEAPEHTLIACGDRASTIDRLERVKPYAIANVLYAFHCFDPLTFTQQGATWGNPEWQYLKGLPYPSSPQALRPVLGEIETQKARTLAKNYGSERWNAEKIDSHIRRAAKWSGDTKAAVYCGAFGASRGAPEPSRLTWLRDMARALKTYKIGWAMWDFLGDFRLADGPPGRRMADPGVLRALGL
jgi:hypothetical protein